MVFVLLSYSVLFAAEYRWVDGADGYWSDIQYWTANGQYAVTPPQQGDTVYAKDGSIRVLYGDQIDGVLDLRGSSMPNGISLYNNFVSAGNFAESARQSTVYIGDNSNTTVYGDDALFRFYQILISATPHNFGEGSDTPHTTNFYAGGVADIFVQNMTIGAGGAYTDPSSETYFSAYDVNPSANMYLTDDASLYMYQLPGATADTNMIVNVQHGLLDLSGNARVLRQSNLSAYLQIGQNTNNADLGKATLNMRDNSSVEVDWLNVYPTGTVNQSGGQVNAGTLQVTGRYYHSGGDVTAEVFHFGTASDHHLAWDSDVTTYTQTGGTVKTQYFYSGVRYRASIAMDFSQNADFTVDGASNGTFSMGTTYNSVINLSDDASLTLTNLRSAVFGDGPGGYDPQSAYKTQLNQTGGVFVVGTIQDGLVFASEGGAFTYNLSGTGQFRNIGSTPVVFGHHYDNLNNTGLYSHGILNLSGDAMFDNSIATLTLGDTEGQGTVYQRGGTLVTNNLQIHSFTADASTPSAYHFYTGDLKVTGALATDGFEHTGYLKIHCNYGGSIEVNVLSEVSGVLDLAATKFYLDSSDKGVTDIDVTGTAFLNTLENVATVAGFANINEDRYLLIDASAGSISGSREVDTILSPYYDTEIDMTAKTVSLVRNDAGQGLEWNMSATPTYIFDEPLETGIIKVTGDAGGENVLLEFTNMTDEYAPLLLNYINEGLNGTNLVIQMMNKDVYALVGDFMDDSLGYTFFAWDLIDFNDSLGLVGDARVELYSLSVPEPSTWVMLLLGALAVLRFRKRRGGASV